MTNSRKIESEGDGDETVVGALNPKLMEEARRSDPPSSSRLPQSGQAISATLPRPNVLAQSKGVGEQSAAARKRRSSIPIPPSQRGGHTTNSTPLADEKTTVLQQEALDVLKGARQSVRSTFPPRREDRSVILSEPAPSSKEGDDETTQPFRDGTLSGTRGRASSLGSQALADVTTARALRLRQVQADQRRQSVVFAMGMVVGALAATVVLLAILLGLVVAGRVHFDSDPDVVSLGDSEVLRPMASPRTAQ